MSKKILGLIFILGGMLYAANIPMSPTTEIVIKKGKFAAISFPFDIVSIDKSPFVSKESQNTENKVANQEIQSDPVINSEQLVNSEKLPTPSEVTKKARGPIAIKQDKRMISLFPNKLGTTELTVYGNKDYVMHISIIVKDKAGADHFNFVGNSAEYFVNNDNIRDGVEEIKSFEMVEHEEVISKLIKYAYSNMVPDGYISKNASNSYKRAGLKFSLQKKIIGDSYELDTWIVKNIKQGRVNLYPEMFYQDGIYSVSFVNPRIDYGEATKMFIIRKP